MSRLASLPIAARLGAGFGLLALALLAVTLIASRAFGTFHDDTQRLEHRDLRALAVASKLGQDLQGTGRETAEHLYVYDGDIKTEDRIQRTLETLRTRTEQDGAALTKLLAGTSAEAEARAFTEHAATWSALVEDAIVRSRAETLRGDEDRSGSRDLYTSKISPQTDELAAEAIALQSAVRRGANETTEGVAARAT